MLLILSGSFSAYCSSWFWMSRSSFSCAETSASFAPLPACMHQRAIQIFGALAADSMQFAWLLSSIDSCRSNATDRGSLMLTVSSLPAMEDWIFCSKLLCCSSFCWTCFCAFCKAVSSCRRNIVVRIRPAVNNAGREKHGHYLSFMYLC